MPPPQWSSLPDRLVRSSSVDVLLEAGGGWRRLVGGSGSNRTVSMKMGGRDVRLSKERACERKDGTKLYCGSKKRFGDFVPFFFSRRYITCSSNRARWSGDL